MTYTVRNLTSRLLCLHGSSGASYYIHAKKSLEIEEVEIRGNPTVEKLLKRNILQVEHHAAKPVRASTKTKSTPSGEREVKSKAAPAQRGTKAKKRATG